jgi:hypothetical protein
VADIFDRLSDGTFAPNEVKLAKMLEGLKEGETLYVDENVVGIYYGNKLINFFKKKDGKIFANVDEIDVPLPQNPLDALNYKEPPSEVERFVAATGLIGTELELFNRLLKNNIIILEC